MSDMADFCREQEEKKPDGSICYRCGTTIGDDYGEPRLCVFCEEQEEDHFMDVMNGKY